MYHNTVKKKKRFKYIDFCQIVTINYFISLSSDDCFPGTGFCDGKANGNYQDPDNCYGFIACSNQIVYKMNCSVGLKYNKNTDSCDWPQNVQCPGRDNLSAGSRWSTSARSVREIERRRCESKSSAKWRAKSRGGVTSLLSTGSLCSSPLVRVTQR